MRNVKKAILSSLMSIVLINAFGQSLKVGDKLPDLEFTVSNFSQPKIRFADLKGKLVILDFWTTHCISCINSFSRIDALQRKFGKKIQIILINQQSADSVDRFFAYRKKLNRPALPFICGDKVLHKLFPHDGVPYHVWIDSTGIIQYTTTGKVTDEVNISSFLAGNYIKAENYGFRPAAPSFFDSSRVNSLLYYSYLGHCIEGIRLIDDEVKGFEQISCNCHPVFALYKMAFEDLNAQKLDRTGRIIFEVTDTNLYKRPGNPRDLYDWTKKYCFNYHLKVPKDYVPGKFAAMRNDLERYFGFEAGIVRRPVKCLVMTRAGDLDKLLSRKKGSVKNLYFANNTRPKMDSIRFLQHVPFSEFVTFFKYYIEYYYKTPFIDETGITDLIDIVFKGSTIDNLDLTAVRKELAAYDLKLMERVELMDVLLIREKRW